MNPSAAKLLVVDDVPDNRDLLVRRLNRLDIKQIDQASNGVEALEVIEKEGAQIDLVVSDVVMPEMDGPTLLKELRRINPGMKMIFVSGYAEQAFEKNLPEGQAPAFLPKPFTLKQLATAVKETMAAQ